MKNHSSKIALLFVAVTISLLQACQKDDPDLGTDLPNSFYSPSLQVGNGIARAWVTENNNGEPVAVGITFSENALENLPVVPTQYVLTLPENKGKNFYTHVLVDWNPNGHEPAHVYDLPHFDVHFYIIPNEERLMIGPIDTAKFANAPAPKYLPPNYMQIPGGVPQMGAHWADLLSPEFQGQVFTKTLIWGSYDGKFIFWEPMVTRDYLLGHPDDLVDVRQPQSFQVNGYYATKYKVSYSVTPKEYTIAIMDLVYHAGE
ncbi:MAG: DUF5602 domain-containing protein [Methanosarcina sp.]